VRLATQYASAPCKLSISSHLFARWHLFRHVDYLRHQQQIDLWPFDLESGVRVTCDVGYLCANFSLLPRPLCSRVRPDVRDRQTDRRQTKASLNASALWGRRHNNFSERNVSNKVSEEPQMSLWPQNGRPDIIRSITWKYMELCHYPRDVVKRGTCYGNVAGWLAGCLSHAGIVSKRQNLS